MTREGVIKGLRDLADLYEREPDFPLGAPASSYVWVTNREELARITRLLGGGEKYATDLCIGIRRRFGSLTLDVTAARKKVCTVKTVRTEWVPEYVFPGYEKTTIEWDCPESLLDIEDAEAVKV